MELTTKHQLTVQKIANILGVEEGIIEWILQRDDSELKPYIQRGAKGSDKSHELMSPSSEAKGKELTLELEGLPFLIKRLAYNIPTTDIIENLVCQVLHLEVLTEENERLKKENQQLRRELDALKYQEFKEKNNP